MEKGESTQLSSYLKRVRDEFIVDVEDRWRRRLTRKFMDPPPDYGY